MLKRGERRLIKVFERVESMEIRVEIKGLILVYFFF